ncbi:metalloregulator ArsR/SmtB family transcription factor [Lachnospiraceae bacterium ZAX-1]
MPMNQEEFEHLSELFKIFGTPTRLQILYALVDQEKCVYDIAKELNMSQSAISHQLSILKQNRLVKNRRDGKTIYYSLLDAHVLTIIAQGLEHVRE